MSVGTHNGACVGLGMLCLICIYVGVRFTSLVVRSEIGLSFVFRGTDSLDIV